MVSLDLDLALLVHMEGIKTRMFSIYSNTVGLGEVTGTDIHITHFMQQVYFNLSNL